MSSVPGIDVDLFGDPTSSPVDEPAAPAPTFRCCEPDCTAGPHALPCIQTACSGQRPPLVAPSSLKPTPTPTASSSSSVDDDPTDFGSWYNPA